MNKNIKALSKAIEKLSIDGNSIETMIEENSISLKIWYINKIPKCSSS